MTKEEVLYDNNPSMFRNAPLRYIVVVLSSLVLIGLFILIPWWMRTRNTKLKVTSQRVILRTGILNKHINEIDLQNVSNIQIKQTFMNRIFKAGTIKISSAGTGNIEIIARGIPQPNHVKELIRNNKL